jgi:spore coat protein A
MPTRREILKLGLLSSLHFRGLNRWASQYSAPRIPFHRELPIPGVLTTVDNSVALDICQQAIWEGRIAPRAAELLDPSKCDYYEIRLQETPREILPGLPTRIWGYNGQFPGPTIKAKVDRPVMVRFINHLPNRVVTHQHGGHTPSDSDGYSVDRIRPAASRVYIYPNTSTRGATLWYHDHNDGGNPPEDHGTGHNVYFGLAGFYLLDDDWEHTPPNEIRLPRGRYDVPLLIQDRLFNPDGSLHYPPFEMQGIVGDTFLVNGAVQPRFRVERRKYRFRFLNGSNARVYELLLSSGQFLHIASDGGLLPRVVSCSSVRIAPGERVEVVVDFGLYPRGTQIYLRNCAQQTSGLGPDKVVPVEEGTNIMRFDVCFEGGEDETVVPADGEALRPLAGEEIFEEEAAITRDFHLDAGHGLWLINGKFFEPHRNDTEPSVRLNTTEIWRISNRSDRWVHPFHIHLEQFRILDRNGRKPGPLEAGLKDTFLIGQSETVRVIGKFRGQPKWWLEAGGLDNEGDYLFHCHNLEHEDMHMMGTFRVEKL